MTRIEVELTDEHLERVHELAARAGMRPEEWLKGKVIELFEFCRREEEERAAMRPSDLHIPKPPER